MQWYHGFSVVFSPDFVAWNVTFYHLMLIVTGGRQRLLDLEHPDVLSAGLISHNSIKFLIITADFVALFNIYWICCFHLCFIFAGVESGDQFWSVLKFCPVFPGLC